jgi:NAD(P)-dependent dehydrogenase (short-subunit alcohol dehydrogenase family)
MEAAVMTDRLRGKVAVVTGASRGIGEAIARGLAADGARVACVARTRNEGDKRVAGSLQATVAAIEAAGGEAVPLVADLRDLDACAQVIDDARATLGPIDILVNNAAWTWFAPVAEFPVDQWLRSFAINVHAPMVLSQAVLADMIPRQSGAIVNISSGSARGPGRGPYPTPPILRDGVLYGTEKAALERFSQGLAEELYPHGITVAALSPSQVVVTAGVIFHEAVFDRDEAHTEPPEMMAQAVVLLASEPLDRVTGRVCYSQQILREFGWIDGGRGTGIDSIGSGYSQM